MTWNDIPVAAMMPTGALITALLLWWRDVRYTGRLEKAIRRHRSQRLSKTPLADDVELYGVLPEGYSPTRWNPSPSSNEI